MPLDTATTIAEALDKRARAPRKTSRKPASKKAVKCHRPGRESAKTITNRLYGLWADIVKSTFDNKCAVCGIENSHEHPLNAHHVMPRQNFSGLRFDPNNGVALCPKCHKMGKFSAHKGGIWFAQWMSVNLKPQYDYCLDHRDDELDCKDRYALYDVECDLHSRFNGLVGDLPSFKITAVTRDGIVIHGLPCLGTDGPDTWLGVNAYNRKAAEFRFTTLWNRLNPQDPIKGIVKVEKTR